MNSKKFSAIILRSLQISSQEMSKCFDFLQTNNFKALDFENNEYCSIAEVLEKYPDEPRYHLKYEEIGAVITNAEDKKYLLIRIDGNSKNSKILLPCITNFCQIFGTISFSYIDNEADPPKQFENIISNTQLKWMFKYNFIGKDFLSKYGRDFFSQIPSVATEYINDDIVRIDLVKDISDSIDAQLKKEILTYLSSHSIQLNFYDYNKNMID